MKKVLTVVAGALLSVCLLFTIAACGGGGSVDGKTYVFDSLEISTEGMSDAEKDLIEIMQPSMEAMFKKLEFSFKDGKITVSGSLLGEDFSETVGYVQEGDKIKPTEDSEQVGEMTVKGNKLVMSVDEEGMKVSITLKQK